MTEKYYPPTIDLKKPHRSLVHRIANLTGGSAKFSIGELRYSKHLDPITRQNGEFLLECINKTADLNALGQHIIKNFFQEVLLNNHQISKRLAETAFPPVKSPIIILGPPRTGSTYLFNLLGSTDIFRTLRNWETHKPASQRPDLFKKIEALFLLKLQHHLAPGLRTIHEQRLEGPEECTKQVLCSFVSQMFPALFHIPDYNEFLETADYLPTYELYYKQLQILGDHGKRWLLKSPIHTQSIDSLLQVFPDAKIIQLERDFEEVLGSICSLSAGFRCMVGDRIDGRAIGREVRKFLVRDTERSQKILAEHPEIVLKIHYRQFIDHPVATIQEIFEFVDAEFSSEAEDRIKSEMKVSVPNKFGRHIYRLEDYF